MSLYSNLHFKLPVGSTETDAWANSLGGKVMAKASSNSWTPVNNMTQITDAFYKELVNFEWIWTPSNKESKNEFAAKMLDGKMTHAQCALPVKAFIMLLTTKAPHGFGLQGGDVKLATYKGMEACIGANNGTPESSVAIVEAPCNTRGFYSAHPETGVHGLKPNILDPKSQKTINLYGWENHKVVEYKGRYWDVCYNKSYTTLQEMAVAIVIRSTRSRESFTFSEAKVLVKNWFQIAYFRSNAEQVNGRLVEEGVYTESAFGDESTDGQLKPVNLWASTAH